MHCSHSYQRAMAGPKPPLPPPGPQVPAAFTSAWWKDCTPMAGAAAETR